MQDVNTLPTCPYCGSVAPPVHSGVAYGDERYVWITHHIHSSLHRWWWKLRKKVKS